MLLVLSEFNTRTGNQLLWSSEPINNSEIPELEFKMIPSGLHERQNDTIYFQCGNMHGISRYESRIPLPGSREGIQMFALGALVSLDEEIPWKYEPVLRARVVRYLDTNLDISVLQNPLNSIGDPKYNPLNSICAFLLTYGSLSFEIWKLGLTRSRIIFEPVQTRTIRSMCHFVHIASMLSSIPQDVADLLPTHHTNELCLYNVIINDIPLLQQLKSFTATTTDDLILSPAKRTCEYIVKQDYIVDMTSVVIGDKIRSTYRDRTSFKSLCDFVGLRVDASTGLLPLIIDFIASSSTNSGTSNEQSLLEIDLTASFETRVLEHFALRTKQLVRTFASAANCSENFIRLGGSDIAEMGLDPFSYQDREFLVKFADVWFERPVRFTGCCC